MKFRALLIRWTIKTENNTNAAERRSRKSIWGGAVHQEHILIVRSARGKVTRILISYSWVMAGMKLQEEKVSTSCRNPERRGLAQRKGGPCF